MNALSKFHLQQLNDPLKFRRDAKHYVWQLKTGIWASCIISLEGVSTTFIIQASHDLDKMHACEHMLSSQPHSIFYYHHFFFFFFYQISHGQVRKCWSVTSNWTVSLGTPFQHWHSGVSWRKSWRRFTENSLFFVPNSVEIGTNDGEENWFLHSVHHDSHSSILKIQIWLKSEQTIQMIEILIRNQSEKSSLQT